MSEDTALVGLPLDGADDEPLLKTDERVYPSVNQLKLLDRRRNVATLALKKTPPHTIAEILKVKLATVRSDIRVIRKMWTAELGQRASEFQSMTLAQYDADEHEIRRLLAVALPRPSSAAEIAQGFPPVQGSYDQYAEMYRLLLRIQEHREKMYGIGWDPSTVVPLSGHVDDDTGEVADGVNFTAYEHEDMGGGSKALRPSEPASAAKTAEMVSDSQAS